MFTQLSILVIFSRNTDFFQCATVEPVKVARGFCSWFSVHDTAAISVRCRSECDVGFRDGILQIIEVPALGSFMQKLEVCLVLTQCVKVRRTDLA